MSDDIESGYLSKHYIASFSPLASLTTRFAMISKTQIKSMIFALCGLNCIRLCTIIKLVSIIHNFSWASFKGIIFVAKAVEYMIIDGLLAAEPVLKIAEQVFQPERYLHLTDDIMPRIEADPNPVGRFKTVFLTLPTEKPSRHSHPHARSSSASATVTSTRWSIGKSLIGPTLISSRNS